MRFLILLVSVLFAFNNGTFVCETIGVEFKDGNKTISIGNNEKSKSYLQKTLKDLYKIGVEFNKNDLTIKIGKDTQKVEYLKNLQKNIRLYKAEGVYIIVDDNSSQIAINIPTQSVIYYQCR